MCIRDRLLKLFGTPTDNSACEAVDAINAETFSKADKELWNSKLARRAACDLRHAACAACDAGKQ
eukprot:7744461-Alexandrium_andersonii.AAC.1